ncbi:MAG: nucleotidyltransferase domain-containing protein [Spirochaetota bacterium]
MSEPTLNDQTDPFTPAERQRLLDVLARWQPQAAWLFGSRARDDATADSDVDLLIMDERVDSDDNIEADISVSLFPRAWHLDIIGYSPERGNTFLQTIIAEGLQVYG